MKYIITALSTTLFMSLMLHIANYEDIYHTKQNDEIGNKIIRTMSDRIMELESKVVDE